MKKLFPIALVAVAAMTFTSCKKDYTCKCTATENGQTTELVTVTIHDTKSNAESGCNGKATAFTGTSIQCKIQ